MQSVKAAALFKVLSDPTRLQLLYLVAENPERLCCVDLSEALAVSAPTVTHHMKKTRRCQPRHPPQTWQMGILRDSQRRVRPRTRAHPDALIQASIRVQA
nr:ArsR family transcriptional regulator [Corynebacterium diphtheriae]